jgi:hypothetical protein
MVVAVVISVLQKVDTRKIACPFARVYPFLANFRKLLKKVSVTAER